MRYIVRNSRDNRILADKVEVADTWGSRLKGLLGRESLPEGEGLHIVPCNSIHMFFMKFPIDVAFLDPEGRLVKSIHSIGPWRATRVYVDAHSALELPAGTLMRHGVQEGDQLLFEPAA